jgi:hypothetical protein
VSVQFDPSGSAGSSAGPKTAGDVRGVFSHRDEAVAFDSALKASKESDVSRSAAPGVDRIVARLEQLETQLAAGAGHEGVYAYETRQGTRWRFVFRDADGRLSSRRGFPSADEAAAARRERIGASRAGERLASGLRSASSGPGCSRTSGRT